MLNIELLDDPRISLLINCPREMKSYIHTKICILLFIDVLLVKVKNQKQPKCSSAVEWINKLWYPYNGTSVSDKNQWTIGIDNSMDCVRAELLQSRLTLCNPMDCSLPGSSVPGIFQVRILQRVCHALL